MLSCPHCSKKLRTDDLRQYPSMWANYKICPYCSGRFTVDISTKRRQIAFGVVCVISLALTILLYYRSNAWLAPAVVSYVVLGVILWYGNRHVVLVRYE